MTYELDRRRFLKASLATTFAVSASGLLVACGDDDEGGGGDSEGGEDLIPLSVLMPVPIIMNFIADCAGVSCGFFEEAGLDVDLQFARTAPQAMQQLFGGSADVIRTAPIAIAGAAANEDAPIISIGMPVQEIVYVLVSSPDDPYASLEALEGRTVGLPQLASSAEDTLDLVLRSAGVDPETVERQAVGVESTAYALIEEGRVDAIFATKEAAAAMELAGLGPVITDVSEDNPLLGVALATTTETLEAKVDPLERYLSGLAASMRALNDPDTFLELAPAIREDWDLPLLDDPEAAAPVMATIAGMWFSEGDENLLRNLPEDWEAGVANFAELSIVPEGTDPTTLYTNDLWDEALG